NKALYEPPMIIRWLDGPLSWVHEAFLLDFALEHPTAAINLKLLLLLISGFALAMALGRVEESLGVFPPSSRSRPMVIAACTFAAISFSCLLWILVEPTLFDFGKEQVADVSLDFNIAIAADSLNPQNITSVMTDP